MAKKWPKPNADTEVGRSVIHMRKTFTLVLASVLATGAVQVANADTFTVVDDPASFITIDRITGLATPAATDPPVLPTEGIMPHIGSGFDSSSSLSEFNRLPLTVKTKLGEKDLQLVEVCLFDSDVITGDAIATNCGNGSLAATTNTTLDNTFRSEVATTLTANFKSAVPMAITNIETRAESPDAHVVQTAENGTPFIAGTLTTSLSPLSLSGEGAEKELSGHILFRMNQMPLAADGWKVRVLATYGTGEDAVSLELVDDDPYTVAYLGALSTGDSARPSVNYGDVVQGGTATVEEINTGRYRANNASDITLNAGLFKGPDDGEMALRDPADLADGELSLRCKVGATFDDFFGNGIGQSLSKTLLSNVPYDVPVGSTFSDPVATHDCELKVGADVAVGSYDNTMTVAIKRTTE